MPLTAQSPIYLHLLQNLSLLVLAAGCAPLCTLIAVSSWLISPYTRPTHRIEQRRRWRQLHAPESRRTVLVTGLGMSKGLAIARAFYRSGHDVVGADWEPYGVPVGGRFSTALKRFYRLEKPESSSGSSKYVHGLLDIIVRENVDLWISCSGVASAVEDGKAAEAVETLTNCKVVQFEAAMTSLLHEKHSFIENTQQLGLKVPETHLITSLDEAMARLHQDSGPSQKQFIMKSVGLEDSIRADMSLLPCSSREKTQHHITRLQPSPARPFVLQQFISGPEFCTHSLVVRGQVLAFTACESAELLMHYRALPSSSAVFQAMLKYTQVYAARMGERMTGHFSIDFLLDEDSTESDRMNRIYPIECNPRAHTAVVLFAEESWEMAEAYLAVLDHDEKHDRSQVVIPEPGIGYYWIGHDVVTRLILPLLSLLRWKTGYSHLTRNWVEFFDHVIFWKDGTYEIWDPWPAWALYCVYWPGIFLACILTGRRWSRCNVSTTKVFNC
ncbi:hypothetical protein BUE80_DR013698 [Diplocarpon rosae]|nr:hypothetical protein BUE80_DR013698 [Diplocarpon rosae]